MSINELNGVSVYVIYTARPGQVASSYGELLYLYDADYISILAQFSFLNEIKNCKKRSLQPLSKTYLLEVCLIIWYQ